MTRAEAAGLLHGAPAEMAAEFAALLWGDVLLERLMGVAEAPDAREITRRARAASTALLQLHGGKPERSRKAARTRK